MALQEMQEVLEEKDGDIEDLEQEIQRLKKHQSQASMNFQKRDKFVLSNNPLLMN